MKRPAGPRHARRWWWLALLALGTPLLAGCAGGGERRGALDVEMLDNFYARNLTRVPAGTRVRFSNGGRAAHNAFASNGAWQTPLVLQPGQSATVVLTRPGVYQFYCTFHGTRAGVGMAGTVVVGDIAYSPSAATTGRALPTTRQASGVTRRVPRAYRTIQAAVDAAKPGDLVLVEPGTYREEVKVTIPSLVIRGTDRNRVIVDAEFVRPNAISVTADGVAVESITVRNALANGLFWTGVKGYRASYVTAYNNADYGIYAFGSQDGVFERSYASGSPDAGFYIGQCNPCDAVIDGVVAEGNGILVTPNLDEHFWMSSGNQIRDNVVRASGRADLALAGPAGAGNCFAGNSARSTVPVGLQAFQPCRGLRLPLRFDLSTTLQSLGIVAEANTGAYPHNRSQDAPAPAPQPRLPGGAAAPVHPAVDVYRDHDVDLDHISVPAPAGEGTTVRKEPTVSGVPILASSAWQLIFGLYGYMLPFALFAAWMSLAIWDLARRDDLSRGATVAWVVVVLVVPFLGVLAYHALGRPKLPGWLRIAVIGGGIAAYVAVIGVGAWIGGIV